MLIVKTGRNITKSGLVRILAYHKVGVQFEAKKKKVSNADFKSRHTGRTFRVGILAYHKVGLRTEVKARVLNADFQGSIMAVSL